MFFSKTMSQAPGEAEHQSPPGTGTQSRVQSIDMLRGLVMIVMALDHVRDFFGVGNPSDLVHGTVPLFFTRWITDFCAPVFFLLTGTSAYLAGKARGTAQLSTFLLTRGLWLILLETTFLRCFGWQFNFDYHVTLLSVIWALGCAMIVLSMLVWLRLELIAGFGFLLIVLHNLADGVQFNSAVWTILHQPGFLLPGPQRSLFVAYPLVPWVGVTALGFALGALYQRPVVERRKLFIWAGVVMILLFVAIRWMNGYGDPQPWTQQRSLVLTVCSFLDATKYPPSLDFLLMTLGPAALLMAAFESRLPRIWQAVSTFGKVPLFYYLLHVITIHIAAVLFTFMRYGHVYWMFRSDQVSEYPVSRPPHWGMSLLGIYGIWFAVVAILYPLCRWYVAVKKRRAHAWLSYL